MGILRTDRVSGLGGANAIKGSVFFGNCLSAGSVLGFNYLITERSDNFTFGTGDITIEGWFFCPRLSSSTGYQSLVGDTIYSGTGGFTFYIQNGQLNFWKGTNASSVVSGGTIVQNEWTHLAYTRESGSNKIFVNGSLVGTNSDSTDYTDTALTIGTNKVTQTSGSEDVGQYSFTGFASNVRVLKGRALYTAAFTPPVGELQVIDNTVLLCCQSPGNVLQEATGVILTAPRTNNSAGAQASHFTPNSPVGFSTTTDVGTQFGSTFDGVTTFDSQAYFVPPGGNTRERNRGRGLLMGGAVSPGATNTTQIKYFNIAAGGITEDFGQTTVARRSTGSFSSSTRALMGGGFVSPTSPAHTISDVIDFVTIANTANAIDFGDMQSTGYAYGTASNETRGLFAGGYRPNNSAVVNTIDLITIATAGNASNFADLTRQVRSFGGFSSSTRGVFAGGTYPAVQDVIDFVTFASQGVDASDFGNLTDARDHPYGASSSTRGVMGGGRDPNTTNIIDFITIASTGNAIDFGDLSQTSYYFNAATANSTRAVWIGNSSITNAAEFVTIATTGNAVDFGDQNGTAQHSNGACSDSHGGLE